MSVALEGHELVAHHVLRLGDADRHRVARELWERITAEFALTDAIARYPAELPAEPPAIADGESLLAARAGRAPGTHQVVARRVHNVLVLSYVCAPENDPGWTGFVERWRRARVESSSAVLGTVRILQARLADDGAVPADVDPGELPGVPALQRWIGGVVEPETRLSPLGLWEAIEEDADQAEVDGRSHRDLVVLAPAACDPQMSAFTWSRGGPRLTPFGNYLVHAAKLRYAVRTRAVTVRPLPGLTSVVNRARAELTPIVQAGRPLTGSAAADARVTLAALTAADLGLAARQTKLTELLDAVAAAEANMSLYVGLDRDAEPFADDRAVAVWLTDQLGRDLGHIVGPRTLRRHLDDAARPLVPPEERPVEDGPEGTDTSSSALVIEAFRHNPGDPRLKAFVEGGLFDLDSAVAAARDGDIVALGEIRPPAEAFVDDQADTGVLEHVVRAIDGFLNPWVFWSGLEAGVRRACLVDTPTVRGEGGGTGFLVGPDLVLTNHHVVAELIAASASSVRCVFDHVINATGGIDDDVRMRLADDWLVASSPPSPLDRVPGVAGLPRPDELDYAVIRLAEPVPEPDTGRPRGWYDLRAAPPLLQTDQTLLVLQHPAGQRLKLAFGPVVTLNANQTRLTHRVNTLSGSSGGPCLTLDMRLAALHHAGTPRQAAPAEKLNAAVPIGSIMRHIDESGAGMIFGT